MKEGENINPDGMSDEEYDHMTGHVPGPKEHKKGFWAALFAKPWALKIHYKKAIKDDDIVDLGELELEVGIVWLFLLILLIII